MRYYVQVVQVAYIIMDVISTEVPLAASGQQEGLGILYHFVTILCRGDLTTWAELCGE